MAEIQRQVVLIDVVDMVNKEVHVIDKHQGRHRIGLLTLNTAQAIPAKNERWLASRVDYNWTLDSRIDDGTETSPLASMAEGDTRVHATNNMRLDASKFFFNGYPFAALRYYKIDIAWNTPGIETTGIPLWTPSAVGEVVLQAQSWFSISTSWNGDPGVTGGGYIQGIIYVTGEDPYTLSITGIGVTIDSATASAHAMQARVVGSVPIRVLDTTPWRLIIQNADGNPPGATTGAGYIVLVTVNPADL